MTTPVLERVEPQVFNHDDLILKAAEELHYTALKTPTLKEATVAALKRAGVRPFNKAQVDTYMEVKEREENRWFFWTIAAMLGGLLVVPPLVALILWSPVPLVVMVALPITFAVATGLSDMLKSWRWQDLAHYGGEVPGYALQTALTLKEELQNVNVRHRFLIASLVSGGRTGDPFLVLEVDGCREYLEVWDEPGFFKQRTV